MLIKTQLVGATHLVHAGVMYKVVHGFADVPLEVRTALTTFPDWNDVTEEVDESVRAELVKTDEDAIGDVDIKALKAEAKELGISGYTKMSQDELVAAIEAAKTAKTHPVPDGQIDVNDQGATATTES